MRSRSPNYFFGLDFAFSCDSLFFQHNDDNTSFPPVAGNFELLDGTPFLLLDGTDFLLL